MLSFEKYDLRGSHHRSSVARNINSLESRRCTLSCVRVITSRTNQSLYVCLNVESRAPDWFLNFSSTKKKKKETMIQRRVMRLAKETIDIVSNSNLKSSAWIAVRTITSFRDDARRRRQESREIDFEISNTALRAVTPTKASDRKWWCIHRREVYMFFGQGSRWWIISRMHKLFRLWARMNGYVQYYKKQKNVDCFVYRFN